MDPAEGEGVVVSLEVQPRVALPQLTNASAAPWARRIAARLAVTDAAIVGLTTVTAAVWPTFAASSNAGVATAAIPLALACLAFGAAWILCLSVFGAHDYRTVGGDATEYGRIVSATVYPLFTAILVVLLLDGAGSVRDALLGCLLGLPALLFSRWIWRRWLRSQRRAHGRLSFLVVLVGSQAATSRLARELFQDPGSGYRVLGACVPDIASGTLPSTDVPVLGGLDEATEVLRATSADTIMVASGDDMTPERVNRLAWELDPAREHLVVAPSLSGVAGSRIATRPVAHLALLHLQARPFSGPHRYVKRAFDLVVSLTLLVLLSPVLAVVALLVRLSDSGPVFYHQERIGRDGQPFLMRKFRSMRVGADAELAALLRAQGRGDSPLFKVDADPRITRIGAFLRRSSLDELPQLLNVVSGEMSLVGPRPQRAGEVALYQGTASRRLAVKPGMSGLWQVSGRSALSWEDAITLDLFYVENWSLLGDFLILIRTARAVLVRDGAV